MKVKRLLVLLFTLTLLIGSAFAISASATGDAAPRIASYNISYEGDFKFMVAVPKDQVVGSLTFTVRDTVTGASVAVTKTVEELQADQFADPTLSGVAMWAIRSDVQISAKDMAREYELTVTSNGLTSDPVTYSLAMYLNERLYKNGMILAEDGTVDADRRDLYLNTLKYGHNAEYVLYNLDDDPTNDVTVFVDQLVYSNISGKYALYTPGTVVNSPEGFFKVSGFSCTDGVWSKDGVVKQLTGAGVTLDSHQIYTTELVESFRDGQISTSFNTSKLSYTKPGGDVVVNAPIKNGYYTEEGDGFLRDAAGNTYYDRFSLVGSFQGYSKVLRIQNLAPVIYDENDEPTNPRNNPHIATPLVSTVATDSLKTNDVYVLELDINIQSENGAGYQLVMRDINGNAMYNLTLVNDGALLYKEITPGVVVDFEQTVVNTDISKLIFDKAWHNIRVEIGFNYRQTKVYVDDALVVEYIAGLQNTYDYGKDVEARRAYGSAEFFVANDYVTDVYIDNVIFTKNDKAEATVWDAGNAPSLVTATDLPEDVKANFIANSGVSFTTGTANRVVIGYVAEDYASVQAYESLYRGIPEHYDSESSQNVYYGSADGYVIAAMDNAIAIAYTDAEHRDLAISKFIEDYASVETLTVKDGILASYYDADTDRGLMHASYMNSLLTTLKNAGVQNANEIVNEISNIYGNLYSGEILNWIASLYDPEKGGFYYSESAKNTAGFAPDLESTSQATAMLERLGIVSKQNYNFYFTVENVGQEIHDTMLAWLRSLQAEDGCFYHPQWEGLEMSASRIGRDIDNAVHLFGRLGEKPYYDIPGTDIKGIGVPVTPTALTGRLSDASNAFAVSKIVLAADSTNSTLPTYLQSIGNWASYLQGLGFNGKGRSYSAGNTISSIHRLVTQADINYAANPDPSSLADYSQYIPAYETTTTPYVDYLENYLNSIQLDNGFWEENDENGKPTWAGLNGLMKISAAYGSYKRTVQKSYAAFQSTLQVAQKQRSGSESACYIFNAWTCLSTTMRLVRTADAANGTNNFADAKADFFAVAPQLIATGYDVYSHHAKRRANGDVYGFSYYENTPMNNSQSAPVAHSAYPEADINSTMLATSSFLGVLFSTLNAAVDPDITDGKSTISVIPLWNCDRDFGLFVEAWQNADPADKTIQAPETITFDDYIADEEATGNVTAPHALVHASVNGLNTSLVAQAPEKAAGDLAFKLHHVAGSAYNQVHVNMVDEMRDSNVSYLEMDLYIDEFAPTSPDNDLFMQILFIDPIKSTAQTGFNFYRESDTSFRIQSSYNHLGASGSVENQTVSGVTLVDNWIHLKLVTTKIYTDKVLTGLVTEIYVNDMAAISFTDTFAYNTATTDVTNDIVDVNIGRAQIVQYKQGVNDVDSIFWLDNIYCGKIAKN